MNERLERTYNRLTRNGVQETSSLSMQAASTISVPYSAAKQGFRRWPVKEWLLFVLFIGPNLLLFSIFSYWPMVYSGYLSTVRWDMLAPVKLGVGLDNYRYLWENETFHKVLWNSLYFTVGAVGGAIILGLAFALLLNQPLRGRDGARAIIFMPTLISGAVIGLVWAYIFDPRYGLIATAVRSIGLTPPEWLRDPEWAMPAIIIVYIWKNVGFSTVIFLAGLQAIPKDLYEAAKVDGAGPIWRFKSVTLPMLSPIMFFVVITSILSSFQAFDIINVMTRGGPVDATNTLIYYIYEQGFVAFNAGRAAAASIIMFALMLAITLFQMRVSERKVHYG
jgi:multiple sugar transport system permease protein/sn-glycerol 3-phosphate transport system permease protein